MKKRRPRPRPRVPAWLTSGELVNVPLDPTPLAEDRRVQTLENELATDATMEALHSARRIIECLTFVGHEQRRVNAEWLRRHPG